MAAMVAARPALGARLLLAPREAVHAVGAYLQHRLYRDGDDGDPNALAAAVDRQHARHLLREAVPRAHPRLYRVLARCGPRLHPLAFYSALNDALHGPLRRALLRREVILPTTLDLVQRLAADPVLAACHEAALGQPGHLANLEAALALLRSLGLARDIEALPSGSGWRAVAARISADFDRAACPPAPFPLPDGWRQPRRWAEITAVGRTMENCLASPLAAFGYAELWVSGRLVLLCTEARAGIATVRLAAPGLWWISEISVAGDDLPSRLDAEEVLRERLAVAVAASGGRVVASDPWACASALVVSSSGREERA